MSSHVMRKLGLVWLASLVGLALAGMLLSLSGCEPIQVVSSRPAATPSATATPAATPTQGPVVRDLPAAEGTISCPPEANGTVNNYLTCEYSGPHGSQMLFLLFVPRGYSPHQSYPLVLVLHGGGEAAQSDWSPERRREALTAQEYVEVWGPGSPEGMASASTQTRWPSFVVIPQLVAPESWVNVPSGQGLFALTPQPAETLKMAMVIVELLQQQYTGVDSNRLYITGISMGAYGVWDAIERWPTYFAAAAPVSGGGSPALANTLVHVPIWDFHGGGDTIVPTSASRTMIAAIRSAGGNPCYTEYSKSGHSIWGQVYGLNHNPNNPLYPWLFAQRKGMMSSSSPTCRA